MIDFIWVFMIVASCIYSILNGNISQVSSALLQGGETAVKISLSLLGAMGFWLGIIEIAKEAKLTKKLQNLLMPLIIFLFPKFKNEEIILEKISLNFTANLLGLGNAATPMGLEAMSEMGKLTSKKQVSKEMILFVVINTASLQLIPTQMAVLRSTYGSEQPFLITVPVLIVSFFVLVFVIIICKILEK